MDNSSDRRPFAVVTGASSGIGYHLALLCAQRGYDLLVTADTALNDIESAASAAGAQVTSIQADLSTEAGVDSVVTAIGPQRVAVLMANAGHGLGHAFLEQSFDEIRSVIDTNVTGTLYLLHRLLPAMVSTGQGRVLITGSIAGLMPGTFQAVYNGSKAFVDSFAWALRNELKDTGVTVTCLMPGATDTEFFDRADMNDTKIGSGDKMDPAEVAKIGFEAMLEGEGDVVAGWKNKVQATLAAVTPSSLLAEQHRKQAAPGTAS